MAVNPYGLNKKIFFGKSEDTTNPNTGGVVEHFEPVFKRWCGVKTQTISQQYAAINVNMDDTIIVIIRHTEKVKGYKLAKLDGVVYDIVDVSPDESVNVQRFDYVTVRESEKVM